MKKFLLLGLLTLFASNLIQAQTDFRFGVTGGLLNTNADINISALGFNIANIDAVNKTGFYVGVLGDIGISESFHVQPELTYGSAGDLAFVYLPIMAKYYVTEGLHLQAGPQISFSSNLDEIKKTIRDIEGVIGTNGNIDDVLKSTAIELGFGAGYDITDDFMVQARYAFALTDRYDGPLGGALDIKNSTINVGVAYKF
ncbi:MAG: porin family protein [Aurantibacter sp.]